MLASRRVTLGMSVVCATAAQAQVATAVGIVIDSIRGVPLVGATIAVSGADQQGVADSTGRFRIDSIPPGNHSMAVFHPWLEAIGLTMSTERITFAPGSTMSVILATPSAATWIARRCPAADRQNGPNAIMGHVLQLATDDPIPGALVHYSGAVIQVGKDVGLQHAAITRDASVTPDGGFVLCGIPAGAMGTVRASRGQAATGDIPAEFENRSLFTVALRLDTLGSHTGIVAGKVLDDKGTPVPGATVTLRGMTLTTQTSDSGTFSLRDLPLGSQMIDANKVGFSAIGTHVTVLGGQTVVAITLPAAPPEAADAGLAGVGFVRRRLAGGGTFITADTIAKRKAKYLADLQPLMPNLIMRPSSYGPVLLPSSAGTDRCLFYLLDGEQYRWGPVQLNKILHAPDIAGVEYYQYGHVPSELLKQVYMMGFPRCGLIAIWTKGAAGAPE
jgi:hypothetical protein